MKYFITVLLVMIPFNMFGQATVIEPELFHDDEFQVFESYKLVEHNGKVYVNCSFEDKYTELWVFDSEEGSMQLLKDIKDDGNSDPVILSNELEDKLLFTASGFGGLALWSTKGNENSTVRIKYFNFDLDEDDGYYPNHDNAVRKYKDEIYFRASYRSKDDYELWKTDGTSSGTTMVMDIDQEGSSNPSRFYLVNDKLVFQTENSEKNYKDIWVTEGTEETTYRLASHPFYYHSLFHINQSDNNLTHLFFIVNDDDAEVSTLWVTDGTKNGTFQLLQNEINETISEKFSAFDNKLIFTKENKVSGQIDLFISDGSKSGTRRLKTIAKGTDPEVYFPENKDFDYKNVYFFVYGSSSNDGLWVTDGTSEGTMLLTDKDLTYFDIYETRDDGNKIYFAAGDEIGGGEPWVSDGTKEGTYKIKDINGKQTGSNVYYTGDMYNGKIMFEAEEEEYTKSYWITDGTEAGTFKIQNDMGSHSNPYTQDTILKTPLLFLASKGSFPHLWMSDLTEEGTVLIEPPVGTNLFTFTGSLYYIQFEGYTYFFANYNGEGQQLYRIPNTISSVEDTPLQELITVYPNPSKDFIQLELTKPMQLSIVNSAGLKVKDFGVIADGKLNVAELISGVYLVIDEQGNNIAKFVKD